MGKIKKINTDKAPAAIGPYSQAVRAGDFIYVSGQIPMDPVTAKLAPHNIQEQTKQSLNNILAILKEAGADMSSVVKTEVYLDNIEDFTSMNEIYATFFSGEIQPARQAMEVARLPKDVLVEISCVAYLG